MNTPTIELLEDCNSGCKMGLNSIRQVYDFVNSPSLQQTLSLYEEKHKQLETLSADLLAEHGKCEQDPNVVVTTLSWLSTEVKLYLNSRTDYIAKLLINGCDMGIESLQKKLEKYNDADTVALDLCNRIIALEQDFKNDLSMSCSTRI